MLFSVDDVMCVVGILCSLTVGCGSHGARAAQNLPVLFFRAAVHSFGSVAMLGAVLAAGFAGGGLSWLSAGKRGCVAVHLPQHPLFRARGRRLLSRGPPALSPVAQLLVLP